MLHTALCHSQACAPRAPKGQAVVRRAGATFRFQVRKVHHRRFIELPMYDKRLVGVSETAVHSSIQPEVVCIEYDDLVNFDKDLSESVLKAYGPEGLGIVTIKNVPKYMELRETLLPLAQNLAYLSEDEKEELEDPGSSYNFGWSQGKEILESGLPDVFKGSFYANPLLDVPSTDPELISKYPAYCRPNIWPRSQVPELEAAFKHLARLIVEVGVLVARRCDELIEKSGQPSDTALVGRMERVIATGKCHKGRLLYYFPIDQAAHAASPGVQSSVVSDDRSHDESPVESGDESATESSSGLSETSTWCGWHKDHCSLTGLTCAMHTKPGEGVVRNPDSKHSGLYVKNRRGDVIKVDIPSDCLAFQLGEAAEVHSGGLLQATPHCVCAATGKQAQGVGRSTLAVFMQPHWDEPMSPPVLDGMSEIELEVQGWRPGMDFGEFTQMKLSDYYK